MVGWDGVRVMMVVAQDETGDAPRRRRDRRSGAWRQSVSKYCCDRNERAFDPHIVGKPVRGCYDVL
jgi:hypothetical protein